jgi:outer membrane protein TolC
MLEAGYVIEEKEAKNLAALGVADAKLKAESKAYGAGYYDGRFVDTTVSKPLMDLGGEVYTGFRSSEGEFPVYDGDLQTGDTGEARLGVRVPILRNRRIDEARGELTKSGLEVEAAGSKLISTRLKIIRDATIAYWELIAAIRQVHVIRNLVKVARERGEQLDVQVKAGDKPRFDLIDNQRAILKRENELVKVRNILDKALVKLSLYYRDEYGRPIILGADSFNGVLPDPDPNEFFNWQQSMLIEEALDRRPELAIVNVRSQQVAVDMEVAKNQFLPQLDLDASAAQDYGRADKKIDQGELKFGVKIEVPLEYRKLRGKLASAKATSQQLRANRTWLHNQIENEILQSVIVLKATIERIKLARAENVAAHELEDGERERFQQGDSNLIFLNLREQTAAEAAVQVIQSLLDYQMESANLRALLARDEYK